MRILKDEKMMRMLKKDPSAGLDLLIETYGSLVGYIIRHKISSVCKQEDIEECIADVFVDFYKQLDKVDLSKGTLKTYISTIARRRAVDYYNTTMKDVIAVSELDETMYNMIPDDAPSPLSVMLMNEEKSTLLNEVENLGEPDNEILFRRYYLEQSLSEIADAIGMKRPTVSKRIERALDKLRSRMEGYV